MPVPERDDDYEIDQQFDYRLAELESRLAFQELALTDMSDALAASRNALGDHPKVARLMTDLGMLLDDQGKLAEAEGLLHEAVVLRHRLLGPLHPDLALTLYVLCDALLKQRKFCDAEEWLGRYVTPSLVSRPESAPLLRARARVLARRAQWAAASADLWRAVTPLVLACPPAQTCCRRWGISIPCLRCLRDLRA